MLFDQCWLPRPDETKNIQGKHCDGESQNEWRKNFLGAFVLSKANALNFGETLFIICVTFVLH